MKYLSNTLAAICLLCSAACSQVPAKGEPSAPKTPDRPNIHMEGSFDSRRGVMDPISCHGFNIGYFNPSDGDRTVVCFDRLPGGGDLEISCPKKIAVEGYYEQHTIRDGGGPCKDGDLRVFYVTKWHCR